MPGLFDDLIPSSPGTNVIEEIPDLVSASDAAAGPLPVEDAPVAGGSGMFDDLIPKAAPASGMFDDLIPKAKPERKLVEGMPRILKSGENVSDGKNGRNGNDDADPKAPQIEGSFKLDSSGQAVALDDVVAKFKPDGPAYTVTGGKLLVDPKRFRKGYDEALAAGEIDEATHKGGMESAPLVEEALAERERLVAEAGENPALKAVLFGVGRGSASLGAGMAGGAAGSRVAGPIGGLVAGITGFVGGGVGYDAAVKEAGKYFGLVDRLQKSANLEPGYAAAGELATFAVPVPGSLLRMAEAGGTIARAKGGAAAASMIGKQVAAGAGTGAAVDLGFQGVLNLLGVQEGIDLKSTATNAVLGGALAGYGIRVADLSNEQVADVVRRGMAGEAFARRSDREVFAKAMEQLRAIAKDGRSEGMPEFSGSQVEMASGIVTDLETAMRRRPGVPLGGAAPVAGGGSRVAGAAGEFERRAGLSREIVPVGGREVAPLGGRFADLVPGAGPEYRGQGFVLRAGGEATFTGGTNDLAGRTPLAGLLPEGVAGSETVKGKQLSDWDEYSGRKPTAEEFDARLKVLDDAILQATEAKKSVKQNNAAIRKATARVASSKNINARVGSMKMRAASDSADEYLSSLQNARADLVKNYGGTVLPEVPKVTAPEVKAVVAEVKTPEVVKQSAPVDTAAMRGQKKFLLSEIDGALADAPDMNVRELAINRRPDLHDRITELERNLQIQSGPFANQDNLKKMREEIAALEGEMLGEVPKITIEVPGDGIFTIHNTKESLKEFAERAKKFPTTAARADWASSGALPKPSVIPPVKKGKPDKSESGAADFGAVFDEAERIGRGIYREGMGYVDWARKMILRLGERVKGFLHEVWRRLTGQHILQHAREMGSTGDLSVRINGKWVPKEMAHLESIKPAAMPEIVRLARELTKQIPKVEKLRGGRGGGKVLGRAHLAAGDVQVKLDPTIFADPRVAAKVLAHEIGHVVDFAPENTLRRGNVLGHLGSLRDYLKSTLPIDPKGGTESLTAKDRQKLRREAEKAVGPRPAKDNEGDLAAWQAEVSVKYREMVQDEMDARGLATERGDYLPNVREELIALTEFWNPFLEKAGDNAAYLEYRLSGEELYAEMVSVLLNDPAALKRIAPTAYEIFFNNLDKKPEAKRALFELWDWMNKPEAERLAERRAGVLGMFRSGVEFMGRKIAARERFFTFEGFHDGLRIWLDTHYWPIIKRERAAAAAGNARGKQLLSEWFFDSHPLADNDVFLWLYGVQERVRGPLLEADLTEEDLGEFLLWDRIANERYEVTEDVGNGMRQVVGEAGRATIANPQGHNPATAIEQIGFLEEELGPEKFAKLRELAGVFHDEFYKLTKLMRDEGMIGDETWAVVDGNRQHYAAFVPLEYVDTFVSAGIKKQMGTLKDVQNPYISTMLKGITTIRAIEMNRARRNVVRGLEGMFPAEIEPAKTRFVEGRGQVPVEPRNPEQGMITVAEGGKRKAYYVPEEIATMFEREDHAVLAQIAGPLDYLWRNVFYPIFITYNPVFQFVRNPIRDARRTALNLPPGVGVEQAVIMRVTNARAIRDFVERGLMTPEIAAAMEARAFTSPMGTWQSVSGAEDEFTLMARRFGLAPEHKGVWERSALLRPLYALGERVRIAGQVRELVPKLGTYRVLTEQLGWGPAEAGHYVRNYIGTPNYTKQGSATRVMNDIFPFTNVWLKGIQADLHMVARGFKNQAGARRKSPASWWLRWMLTSGSLRVLQAAGAAGLLGAGIKGLYDRVGDYWMTNYDVLPLGEADGGSFDGRKTVFAAVPRDPNDRMLGALVYTFSKAVFDSAMGNEVSMQDLAPKGVSLATSDTPGLNPALKIANGWRQFVQGVNPYDSFRAAKVLTDQQALAGGWPAIGTMLTWSVQQSGLQSFVQYNPDAGNSLEIAVGLMPGINGLIKVTDNGLRESLQKSDRAQDRERAQAAVNMPATVRKLRQEYNFLRAQGGDGRTPLMEARYQSLAGWNRDVYEPLIEASVAAPKARKRWGETAESLSRGYLK
jgi:hypothetical protein